MTIIHNCDSLEDWGIWGGTGELDTTDFVEGTGSILVTGDGVSVYSEARVLFAPQDWSNVKSIILRAKAAPGPILDFFILAPDWANRLNIRLSPPEDTWGIYKVNISDAIVYGTPDLSNVQGIHFMYLHNATNRWFKIDAIETAEQEIPSEKAPPIPLWKVGLVALAILGGSVSSYYLTKKKGR
jgi:hypothetical protein